MWNFFIIIIRLKSACLAFVAPMAVTVTASCASYPLTVRTTVPVALDRGCIHGLLPAPNFELFDPYIVLMF